MSNASFVDKSWLFEVVDIKSGKIEASFTLILPPTAYTIKEAQRVNITKTFRNAFVDDYGPDNMMITIRGISGTAHAFPTFQTQGTSTGSAQTVSQLVNSPNGSPMYEQRGAFYTFRDQIMRYKNSRPDYDRKELRVYDLADEQGYKCVLLDFTLDRSADQPTRYPFAINLFVYADLNSKTSFAPVAIIPTTDPALAVATAYANMSATLTMLQPYRAIQAARSAVTQALNFVSLVQARLVTFAQDTSNALTSPINLSKQLLAAVDSARDAVGQAYQIGKLTVTEYAAIAELIQDTHHNALLVYGYAVTQGAQSSKTATIQVDTGLSIASDGTITRPGTASSFAYTGLNVYHVQGGDSLQSIALRQMGDETLWWVIVEVNNIASNNDLVVGQSLYIPVATSAANAPKDQYIFTENPYRDPFGTDIKVDADGNLVLSESNDFALISGPENVVQAVNLLVNTLVGSMIKQSTYGILNQAGRAASPMAARYTKLSLTSALLADPRISYVNNLQVSLVADAMTISANVGLIGYPTTIPVQVAA